MAEDKSFMDILRERIKGFSDTLTADNILDINVEGGKLDLKQIDKKALEAGIGTNVFGSSSNSTDYDNRVLDIISTGGKVAKKNVSQLESLLQDETAGILARIGSIKRAKEQPGRSGLILTGSRQQNILG